MKSAYFLIILCLFLSACQGSTPWYGEKANNKLVTVNSFKWIVSPNEDKNYYDVSTDSLTISADTEQRRIDQIQAAEMATGCKVTKSKYLPNTMTLRTKVKCKN